MTTLTFFFTDPEPHTLNFILCYFQFKVRWSTRGKWMSFSFHCLVTIDHAALTNKTYKEALCSNNCSVQPFRYLSGSDSTLLALSMPILIIDWNTLVKNLFVAFKSYYAQASLKLIIITCLIFPKYYGIIIKPHSTNEVLKSTDPLYSTL